MPAILWGDWLKIGVAEIDSDHEQLIDLGNQLLESNLSRLQKGELLLLISAFKNLTISHFNREERMMESMNYDGLNIHKIKHSIIINLIGNLEDDVCNGVDASLGIASILADFVFFHLDRDDRALADHIKHFDVLATIGNDKIEDDSLSSALLSVMRTIIFNKVQPQQDSMSGDES